MLEIIIEYLKVVPWYWILSIAFFVTILENLFPPAPCDSVLIFIGTLVGIKAVGLISVLAASTAGSILGFVFMYWLGWEFGIKVIESRRFKFLTPEILKKPEEWFRRWGYLVIVLNRFLSGTRAVISFFAGISKLSPFKTSVYATISAMAWNLILIYLGVILGENWELADKYIEMYGKIILPIIIGLIIIAIAYNFIKKK
ncbi:MAG: hypothetical protein QG635_1351 [Bacteroidota bacterium]|nr:hypothetical protein [Bacteroidota bacterium]